jgi:peptidoglycan-N-acetylmuramic acid deacetylase
VNRAEFSRKLAFLATASILILYLAGCASWERTASFSRAAADFSDGFEHPDSRPDETASRSGGEQAESSLPSQDVQTPETSEIPDEMPALGMDVDFESLEGFDANPVVWGPGTWFDEHNRPDACLKLQDIYGDWGAYFIGPEERRITFTFDQGYENGFTPSILDTLKEKQVQAVFFLTGHYIRSRPDLVVRMIDEGHILGNHTNHHLDFTAVTPEEAFEDAAWMQRALREEFDYEMRLLRLPEGAFSEQVLEMNRQMGYKTVFWSFAYNDWDPANQMQPQEAREKVISRLHPGAIILMHTVGETNSLILADIIDAVREMGYDTAPFLP